MLSTLSAALPVFALIFAGWAARRGKILGAHAASELNRFVVYLALPALLFDIIAHAQWEEIWRPGFIAAFGLGCVLLFAATTLIRLRRRALPDAAIDGLNAAYANTAFMGFPLGLMVLGREAMTPTLIATIITVGLLFIAIVLIEIGQHSGKAGKPPFAAITRALLFNPLLIAPLAGALVPLTGLGVPGPLDNFLKLLGAAAPPCALVALGLFMAEKRTGEASDHGSTVLLTTLKLVAQPAITWFLASVVFDLPAPLTQAAVLLAALPTGTGPFMQAEFYRRPAETTSRVILLSTTLSVLTVSLFLALSG